MGQWSDGIWEGSHSSKLPFSPYKSWLDMHSIQSFISIRALLLNQKHLYCTTHSSVNGCTLAGVTEAASNTGKHSTALQVLRFFAELNKIYLQDAAAMIALTPSRANHPMFKDIIVFRTDEFKAFTEKMRQALEHENNPMDANSESVLPGVHRWQNANHGAVQSLKATVEDLTKEMKEGFTNLQEVAPLDQEASNRFLVASFLQVAKQLIKGGGGGGWCFF